MAKFIDKQDCDKEKEYGKFNEIPRVVDTCCGGINVTQNNGGGEADSAKIKELEAKITALEAKPDQDTKYDEQINKTNESVANVAQTLATELGKINGKDTEQDGKLATVEADVQALKAKTDVFVSDVTVGKKGKKITLTYTRSDGDVKEVAIGADEVVQLGYDDTPIKQRLDALEAKPDQDTKYDTEIAKFNADVLALQLKDNALDGRVSALENKPDQDTIYTAGNGIKIDNNVISLTDPLENVKDIEEFIGKLDELVGENKDKLAELPALVTRVEALENKPAVAGFDDTELKNEIAGIKAILGDTDNDTVFDDTKIKERLDLLEKLQLPKKYVTYLEKGRDFNVPHPLKTEDFTWSLWENNEGIVADVTVIDADNINIKFTEEIQRVKLVLLG